MKNRLHALPLLVFLAGCFESGSHIQDGWDREEDFFEPVVDAAQDEPELEPDLPPEIPACGNGILEEGEECDAGEDNSDTEPDACRTDCLAAHCGDSVADDAEACDGSDFKGETCESSGYRGGDLACSSACQLDLSSCYYCGNGTCEFDEDQETCPTDCFCGNGSCEEAEDQFDCPSDCAAVSISAGGAVPIISYPLTSSGYACGLLSDGTCRCWGENWAGQLGDGTISESYVPVAVTDLRGAVDVSAGGNFTCAVLSGGTAMCWGRNDHGQLGDGTNTYSRVPVAVMDLSNAVAVSTGGFYDYPDRSNGAGHTCALLADNTVMCWGMNNYGQLGDGTENDSLVPVAVSGLTGAVAVSAGESYTCALMSDSTGRCWGHNLHGQLGDGSYTRSSLVPVTVSGLTGSVAISAGAHHACALLSDGTVKCWGANNFGQLGDGTDTESKVPVAVSDLSGAVAVSAGGLHTCAVLSDETVKCWGLNNHGQLGDGVTHELCPFYYEGIDCSHLPVPVQGLTGVMAVSAGASHACALLSDGTVWCWGGNRSGQLGDGISDHPDCDEPGEFDDCSPVPVPVAPW